MPPLLTPISPEQAMQLALAQAALAHPVCRPNPAVGCVLLDATNRLIGYGHTQAPGQAHAEVMALSHAQSLGHSTQGATAYVTLEPCAHQGRTGPCCVALAQAGVAKVVASLTDPNPLVAGQGLAYLQAHGVTVDVGLGRDAALQLNTGFFSSILRKRPWVRLKTAASLDGHTALHNGQSQWITGPAARADTQYWRAQADAVLTGIGTVLADDPLLNVRLPEAHTTPNATENAPPNSATSPAHGLSVRQPLLAIADTHLRTPATARLWQVPLRAIRLFHDASTPLPAHHALQSALSTHPDAQAIALPPQSQPSAFLKQDKAASGALGLDSMLHYLYSEGVQYLHVEAGSTLSSSLMQADLVDEILLYVAPKLLGQGRGLFPNLYPDAPLSDLQRAQPWRFIDISPIGPDLRLRLQSPTADAWLAPLH